MANPFPNFDFDTLIAFYPEDKNRKDLLKYFVNKTAPNLNERDKSGCFRKKDGSRSVTAGLATNDFILDVSCLNGARKILLIDDVIDCGRTINIFLNKLIENSIDLSRLEIKLVCIYHKARSSGTRETCN